jgi:hypothetical protein
MKEIQMPLSGQLHEMAKEDLTHIQDSITDSITALASALLPGNFDDSKILRLSGAAVVADSLAVAVADGWVYYQGKVYRVTGDTVNPGEGNADDNLAATYLEIVDVGSDAAYQDSAPFRVYVDKRMIPVVGSGAGRVPLSDVLDHIIQGIRGEMRDVALLSGMTSEDDVFAAATGLGVKSWTGWAVCDGRNGTPKLNGRTRIGIGTQDDLDIGDTALSFEAGQKLGKNTVLLTSNQSGLRQHDHLIKGYTIVDPPDGTVSLDADGPEIRISALNSGTTLSVAKVDGDATKTGAQDATVAHTNIQPSYACITMIKL